MNSIPFAQLNLSDETGQAIEAMGFDNATDIQAQSIPLIRAGYDVIGRSQTGTGKTVAFGVPAVELIDTGELRNKTQVLILCPTRELAVQACSEIEKIAKYKRGVRAVDIYGGAPMDRQIMRLKRGANIVVGTPGRVMDHLRRRTLKLDHLKMIILDEADEMLNMGFREDVVTILKQTPDERQTILFSATMPPAILALTKQYQKDPQLIEINRKQVTLDNIEQQFYEVPMGRKMDALGIILQYHDPALSIIFCNTKRMVDEVTAFLDRSGYSAEGLHGDMKQSQRTKVMDSFKRGRTKILVATDVAARGIDVNNVDYVINYDVPQNQEYYVHRIGRTGRAGKEGKAVTICSGRRQVDELYHIVRMTKSTIKRESLPSGQDIERRSNEGVVARMEQKLAAAEELYYKEVAEELVQKGYNPTTIAAVALEMAFGRPKTDFPEIKQFRPKAGLQGPRGSFRKIEINIGRENHIAPNHIVGAITERSDLSGRDIGKIEIYDDKTIVAIPDSQIESTVKAMDGCKICGKPTVTVALKGGDTAKRPDYRPGGNRGYRPRNNRKPRTSRRG